MTDHNTLNQSPQKLPNDTLTLVMGIIAIVMGFCCQPVGIVCGIIGLIKGNKGKALFEQNPSDYTQSSFSNIKIGRLLSIIGLILSVVMIIYTAMTFDMAEMQAMMDEIMQQQGAGGTGSE